MLRLCGTFSLMLFAVGLSCPLVAADDLAELVDNSLTRAGDNQTELRTALAEVADEQRAGMEFLIAHMPERDLTSLSAEFLLENVSFAYRAWQEAPWRADISEELFFNDVLPYAIINERRDAWRKDFYNRFQPLIQSAKTPAEAAVILNQQVFPMYQVQFSRERPKADQSPYETIAARKASCSGLSVLLVDACRAVGIPARFAGTPLWANKSGNHSWVEIWDGDWQYTGAAEPAGDRLNQAWFSGRATTAIPGHPLHAIYATSYRKTEQKFPLVWDRNIDYVYAVDVTTRYLAADNPARTIPPTPETKFDIEASMHALRQLETYLQIPLADREPLVSQAFSRVPLTAADAKLAKEKLWADHAAKIRESRSAEMEAKQIVEGELKMPFFYSTTGDKPATGRSLYISMHGGGGAPPRVNDRQWENQKRLYEIPEGIYLAPRAPTNTWNLWHQGHIDRMFDRLIENLVVFEDVDPNRVYLMGYSAGGDGVYQLAPRMADRFAAASMMAGHPNDASPLGLRNLPFSIQVGGEDAAYNRNKVAAGWGEQLDKLREADPDGYVHWTKIYDGKGHWMDREDAAAIPWMAEFNRNPFPTKIVWHRAGAMHSRFYWLAIDKEDLNGNAAVRAELAQQTITLSPTGVDKLSIRLHETMLDLDQEVTVKLADDIVFQGTVVRTIGVLAETLAERGDPAAIFSAEITIPVAGKDEANSTAEGS
ncbi:transglutaminase domain-containing protein [Planctomycetaceae bacterium SH139]